MKNYRVDVFFRGQHTKTEFDEAWQAKVFAEAMLKDQEVASVYFLERMSEGFDVTMQLKRKKYTLKGAELTREQAKAYIIVCGGSDELNLLPLERCIDKYNYNEIEWLDLRIEKA